MRAAWNSGLPLLGGLLLGLFMALHQVRTLYPDPFPRFDRLMVNRHSEEDPALLVAGFRSVAADSAWVQFLEYLGDKVLSDEDPSRNFDLLEFFTLRVARIDPYFREVYFTGASILAWYKNVDRPDEALEVLDEGSAYNPGYWQFQTYAAAIGYKKSREFAKMAQTLEKAARDPDCPFVVQSILANTYKEHALYGDVIRIWKLILDDPKDAPYRERALRSIADIEQLASGQAGAAR